MAEFFYTPGGEGLDPHVALWEAARTETLTTAAPKRIYIISPAVAGGRHGVGGGGWELGRRP